jgi:hypothetical protein
VKHRVNRRSGAPHTGLCVVWKHWVECMHHYLRPGGDAFLAQRFNFSCHGVARTFGSVADNQFAVRNSFQSVVCGQQHSIIHRLKPHHACAITDEMPRRKGKHYTHASLSSIRPMWYLCLLRFEAVWCTVKHSKWFVLWLQPGTRCRLSMVLGETRATDLPFPSHATCAGLNH